MKKKKQAHTLNGSALALPRIVAAIIENNNSPEGIKIPKFYINTQVLNLYLRDIFEFWNLKENLVKTFDRWQYS